MGVMFSQSQSILKDGFMFNLRSNSNRKGKVMKGEYVIIWDVYDEKTGKTTRENVYPKIMQKEENGFPRHIPVRDYADVLTFIKENPGSVPIDEELIICRIMGVKSLDLVDQDE